MAFLKFVAVVVAIWAVYVGYTIISLPIPDDMTNKFEAKLFTGMQTCFLAPLVKFASLIGMNKLDVARGFITLNSRLHKQSNSNVTMREDTFNGVPVVIYEPVGRQPGGPAVMYFHGGGWVYLNVEAYHNTLQSIADGTKFLVISPEYRLAPAHRYPAALEDCHKATEYLMKQADKYKIDPKRVAVMGDSAGGNLAAAVSIAMHTKNPSLTPKIQVPVYPVLQGLDFNLPSYQNDTGVILPRSDMYFFVLAYLIGAESKDLDEGIVQMARSNQLYSESVWRKHGHKLLHSQLPAANFHEKYEKVLVPKDHIGFSKELDELVVQPLFSPLMADDLSGLPEALILTCQYDVLRDDSFIYAERLQKAGVKVTHYHDMYCYHGALTLIMKPPHTLMAKAFKYLVKHL